MTVQSSLINHDQVEAIRLWSGSVWQSGLDTFNFDNDGVEAEMEVFSTNIKMKGEVMCMESKLGSIDGGLMMALRGKGVALY